jgi:hypothetical protein
MEYSHLSVIPAKAGMTANRCLSTPSVGEKEFAVAKGFRLRGNDGFMITDSAARGLPRRSSQCP